MSAKTNTDDLSVLLYMVPFIASGAYAIYLGVSGGVAYLLSSTVYLTVTRDPYVFLAGTLCVTLGAVLEVSAAAPADRRTRLASVSDTLQIIAVTSLVLSIICAIYANGANLSGSAADFIDGRYSILFPLIMVCMSYLMVIPLSTAVFSKPAFLGVVALILVPVSLHEVGKRSSLAGLVVTFILIVVGLFLFMRAYSESGQKKDAPAG